MSDLCGFTSMDTVSDIDRSQLSGRKVTAMFFVFTDLSASTRGWDDYPEAMTRFVGAHLARGTAFFENLGGTVFSAPGDGFHVAFESPQSALKAAVGYLHLLGDEPPAGLPSTPLGRVSITAGPTVADSQAGFLGSALNLASRLSDSAWGGQILASQSVIDAVEGVSLDGISFGFLGRYRFRGFAEPAAVYQVCAATLHADFPPLRAVEHRPSSIARRLDSFIGREADIAAVHALLSHVDTRIVTLTGAGGVGKTRLSEAIADSVAALYSFHVFHLLLAPLSDIDQLPQAIVSAVSLDPSGVYSMADVCDELVRLLKGHKCLLVVDNCEHLIGQGLVGELKGLIAAVPGVQILATSRHALRVPGERVHQLRPLATSWNGRGTSASMQLMFDRARAVNSTFGELPEEADLVADLCNRLSGLPLAIEIVASWADILSPKAMIDRWASLADIPTRGPTSERHSSLNAAIDYSLSLLTAQERAVLEGLCVFPGAFDLIAAEEVWALARSETENKAEVGLRSSYGDPKLVILDGIGRLASKSLVMVDRAGSDAPDQRRFQILQPIREHVIRHAMNESDRRSFESAHSRYFAQRANALAQDMQTADEARAISWFVESRIDIEAAFHRMERDADFAGMRSIALSCAPPFYHLGLQSVAGDWLTAALDVARQGGEPKDILGLLIGLSTCQLHGGDCETPMALLSEALSLCDAVGGEDDRRRVFVRMDIVSYSAGDFESAARYAGEALDLGRRAESKSILPALLFNAALAQSQLGNFDVAWTHCDEARRIAANFGSEHLRCFSIFIEACVLRDQGRFDEARTRAQIAVKGLSDCNAFGSLDWALLVLAQVSLKCSDFAGVSDSLTTARTRMRTWPHELRRDFGAVEREAGELLGESRWTQLVLESEAKVLPV